MYVLLKLFKYMLFIQAKHVIPLQGKEIMHWISDLFLEFKFFEEKKNLRIGRML